MYPNRIVHAACHQGNAAVFGENAGVQCTAIALMFLLLTFRGPLDNWDSNQLMRGMYYGTELYSSIIQRCKMSWQERCYIACCTFLK